MAGGSERRCIELARGIGKHTEHEAFLLADGDISASLLQDHMAGNFKPIINLMSYIKSCTHSINK